MKSRYPFILMAVIFVFCMTTFMDSMVEARGGRGGGGRGGGGFSRSGPAARGGFSSRPAGQSRASQAPRQETRREQPRVQDIDRDDWQERRDERRKDRQEYREDAREDRQDFIDDDDDWVGRYYVKEATLLGISFLPSVAFKVTDKLSLRASLNAMYGTFENKVAINNADPAYGDGQLKLDDNDWGQDVNLGLLYEFSADTRLGLTWSSEVDLDFQAEAEFSNLAPGLSALLNSRGLLNSNIEVEITVPQQVMASIFHQVTPKWAVLGSVGWQDWSEFGQIELGIKDTTNPTSTTQDLDFDDTWYLYGGTLDVDKQSRQPGRSRRSRRR